MHVSSDSSVPAPSSPSARFQVFAVPGLRVRPAAPRDARAHPALRRPDGAVGDCASRSSRCCGRSIPPACARCRTSLKRCCLDRTALSRTLDPLAERGLVAIAAGRDARTREVSLTRAGERALADALPHWRRAQAEVARRIGPAKLQALIATLGDIEALHPDPGGRGR
jgi:hypothetical protein